MKNTKNQGRFRPRVDEIEFNERDIEKMGLRFENILFKDPAKITKKEVDMLKYAKDVVSFRRGLLSWGEFEKKTKKVQQNEGKKNTLMLSLWLRGTRSRKGELLSLEELETLYERIEESLSKIKDASYLHS